MNTHVLGSRWVVGAGVVALLVAAALGVRAWSGKDAREVGALVEMSTTPGYGHEVTFRIPGATVSVEVGPESESVPAGPGGGEDVEAGRGQAFLPVVWQHSSDAIATTPREALADRPARGFEIAVVVDGEAHVVVDQERAQALVPQGRAGVVVPKDVEPHDITVEVSFDGLTQVGHPESGEIDESAAALLYEPVASLSAGQGCWPDGQARRLRMPITCEIARVALRPWDPEHGWVEEPGQAWVYVPLQVSAAHHHTFFPQNAFHTVAEGKVEARLDGAEPVGEVNPDEATHTRTRTDTTYVFRASTEPQVLQVSGHYTLRPGGGQGGKRPYRFTQTMRLR